MQIEISSRCGRLRATSAKLASPGKIFLENNDTSTISEEEKPEQIRMICKLRNEACLIEWKTASSRYPEEPQGLLMLDPQLVC
jgi:hypothetical protein